MKWRKKLTRTLRRLETPWTNSPMSHNRQPSSADGHHNDDTFTAPTVAPFSPDQHIASYHRKPASILIHQKSPLLVATPPQVTRVLASSHPFILPLNHLVGLLSWTTGDAWESLLLVAAFWFTVLYADPVIRLAAPIVLVVGLIVGMYTRRYSPLSSTVWNGEKQIRHRRTESEQQRKSLDEILDTLHTFTARCDVLLDPFFRLTEFLSTQSSATSATTRPALTSLFLRILACAPLWALLALPPLRIITTSRLVLVLGTVALTWHSRPARVSRTILWRSRTVRTSISLITGLQFVSPPAPTTLSHSQSSTSLASVLRSKTKLKDRAYNPGIRFTFTLYENQRRWIGLGWTSSLLAYERQAWTDDLLNPSPAPSSFTLPISDLAAAKWRWVPGSEWKVEGAEKETDKEKSARRIGGGGGGEGVGWTYFDNKWQEGRKIDGWGRYTRSRKWVRDAELVDVAQAESENDSDKVQGPATSSDDAAETSSLDPTSPSNATRRKGWFSRAGGQRPVSVDLKSDAMSVAGSASTTGRSSNREREEEETDSQDPARFGGREWDRSFGDGVAEGLG